MSSDHEDKHFNPERIFLLLLIFTILEVAWGYVGNWLEWGRFLLWGGLLGFAFAKGIYILNYFMHFRYEGWIIKGLIAPTPFLVVVILTVLNPDVGNNDQLDEPIGSMLDPDSGLIIHRMHEFDDLEDEHASDDH